MRKSIERVNQPKPVAASLLPLPLPFVGTEGDDGVEDGDGEGEMEGLADTFLLNRSWSARLLLRTGSHADEVILEMPRAFFPGQSFPDRRHFAVVSFSPQEVSLLRVRSRVDRSLGLVEVLTSHNEAFRAARIMSSVIQSCRRARFGIR